MILDYEIIESENGIIRKIKEEPFFTYGNSELGIYINPKNPTYNALLNLFNSIQNLIEEFRKEIENECKTDD